MLEMLPNRAGVVDATDRLHLSLEHDKFFIADLFSVSLLDGTRRPFASTGARCTFIEHVPERKELVARPGCQWRLGATDITVEVIEGIWPHAQISMDQDARAMYDFLRLRVFAAEPVRRAVAQWKANRTLPILDDGQPMLADYQKLTTWAATRLTDGYGFFHKPGVGKTAPAIEVACAESRKVKNRLYRVLVVCPKNARLNWQREIERFASVKCCAVVLRGDKMDRINRLVDGLHPSVECAVSFIICSYRAAVLMKQGLCGLAWDLVIADESQNFKDPNTQTAHTMLALRDSAQKRLPLSGTPIGNSSLDLWSQLEFIGQGMSGFVSHKNFKSFYGVFETDHDGRDHLIDIQNKPFMRERLSRVSIIISKEEVLKDLPPKVRDVVEVSMLPRQREAYDALRRKLVAEIKSDIESGDNRTLVVQHSLTKLLRLAQITAGYVQFMDEYDEHGNLAAKAAVQWFDPPPKIDALVELLAAKSWKQKTIIWTCWTPELLKIRERLYAVDSNRVVIYYGNTRDSERQEAEDRFNCDDSCSWFLGNPSAGGVALNLVGYDYRSATPGDTNCDQVIRTSQNWSSLTAEQGEDRAHRRTTRCQVKITDLVVPGTLDEEIRERVVCKQLHALDITDIQSILDKVLSGELSDE